VLGHPNTGGPDPAKDRSPLFAIKGFLPSATIRDRVAPDTATEGQTNGNYEYAVDAAGNGSAQSGASTVVVANDPSVAPYSIIAFSQRDFVEVGGLTAQDGLVTVSVIRDGRTVSKRPCP
jgi:hypothetical protein